MNVDSIGLPLILLGAVWGAFSPILKAIEMMNERRDRILDPDSKLTVGHRKLMLYSDWLAIAIATYVFALFIGSLILIAPSFLEIKQEEMRSRATWVFDTVGAIFLTTATIGMLTSIFDFLTILRHLRALQASAAKAETPTARGAEPGATGNPSSR
jgi:hypothetical protein